MNSSSAKRPSLDGIKNHIAEFSQNNKPQNQQLHTAQEDEGRINRITPSLDDDLKEEPFLNQESSDEGQERKTMGLKKSEWAHIQILETDRNMRLSFNQEFKKQEVEQLSQIIITMIFLISLSAPSMENQLSVDQLKTNNFLFILFECLTIGVYLIIFYQQPPIIVQTKQDLLQNQEVWFYIIYLAGLYYLWVEFFFAGMKTTSPSISFCISNMYPFINIIWKFLFPNKNENFNSTFKVSFSICIIGSILLFYLEIKSGNLNGLLIQIIASIILTKYQNISDFCCNTYPQIVGLMTQSIVVSVLLIARRQIVHIDGQFDNFIFSNSVVPILFSVFLISFYPFILKFQYIIVQKIQDYSFQIQHLILLQPIFIYILEVLFCEKKNLHSGISVILIGGSMALILYGLVDLIHTFYDIPIDEKLSQQEFSSFNSQQLAAREQQIQIQKESLEMQQYSSKQKQSNQKQSKLNQNENN